MSPQRACTVWFTGLSGAGKSTLAQRARDAIAKTGRAVEWLDGDEIRANLWKELGWSRQDRNLNVMRIGYICHLLTRSGVIAVASAISPYREAREANRKRIGNYVEVYCRCGMETLIRRDPKGIYRKAYAGELQGVTGVDDPYEAPTNAELVLDTGAESEEESAARVLAKLTELGYL